MEDNENLLTDKGIQDTTMCPLPWKQLQITTTGQVNPCCIWQGKPVGDLKHKSFEEIWNSFEFKKIRKDMMRGMHPTGCRKCFDLEDLGTKSPRWYAYRKYLSDMETITDHTDEQGYDSEFRVECWDIRFSNRCNLACRMCGPEASTAWHGDAEKVFGKTYVDNIKCRTNTAEESKKLLDYLLEHLDVVSEIYFVGGEPLIMPEHYKVLDEVLAKKYSDVYLRYNTNLTTLGVNDRAVGYWLRLMEQGNKIEVGLSLDAVGAVAEYQRYRCNWNIVSENLRKLVDNNIHIMVMPTVSIMNVWHVQDLIDYCLGLGIAGYDIANANIVTGPSHYDMRILPESERKATIDHIKEYLLLHESEEESVFGLRHKFFDPILTFLDKRMDNVVGARQEFKRLTEALDNLRGQDFSQINPQYSNWKEW